MEYFDIKTLLDNKTKKILNTNSTLLNNEDKLKKNVYESICKSTENKIPKDIDLSESQIDYFVDVIIAWIKSQDAEIK